MNWLVFSFLNAFFEALKDVSGKFSLKDVHEYTVAWFMRFFSAVILLIVLLITGIPELKEEFYITLLISGSINTIVTVLYMKAIKKTDLSIALPILTFSPLFLLVTSPLIVNEFPDTKGLFGVVFIVTGAYLLNLKSRKKGLFEPFKMLLKDEGAKLMLVVALFWSVSANYDKIGVNSSSPFFWSFCINAFSAISIFPLLLFRKTDKIENKNIFLIRYKIIISEIKLTFKMLLLTGIFTALSLIFQMIAIQMTIVPYVISIKRTSAMFGVFFGYFFFKEKDIGSRLLGVIIMLIGVVFIML